MKGRTRRCQLGRASCATSGQYPDDAGQWPLLSGSGRSSQRVLRPAFRQGNQGHVADRHASDRTARGRRAGKDQLRQRRLALHDHDANRAAIWRRGAVIGAARFRHRHRGRNLGGKGCGGCKARLHGKNAEQKKHKNGPHYAAHSEKLPAFPSANKTRFAEPRDTRRVAAACGPISGGHFHPAPHSNRSS